MKYICIYNLDINIHVQFLIILEFEYTSIYLEIFYFTLYNISHYYYKENNYIYKRKIYEKKYIYFIFILSDYYYIVLT